MTRTQYHAWNLNIAARARANGDFGWARMIIDIARQVRKGERESTMITKGV